MLHTSLVAAMAVGAFGDARQDSLLDLMPADAAMVMEIGDLHSSFSLPMEERGDWMRFMTDERIQALFDMALEEEGVEVSSMALLGEMAAEIRGGAIAFIDMEEGPFVGAFSVTDEFEEVVLALMENMESPLAEGELLGKRALMDEMETLAFVESDGLTLMIAAEPGEAEATLESLLASMEDGPETAGWWADMAGSLDQPIAQIYMDFGALPIDDDPDFDLAAGIIKFMHIEFQAGKGHEGGVSLSMEFHENEIVDAFANALGDDADPGLLLMAPKGAQTVQCAKLDFRGFVEAFMMFVNEMEPDVNAEEEFEAALEAGSTFLGIDIQSDLIDNLTGDFISFQWLSDIEGILNEDIEAIFDAVPVFGFGISDPEPFIELLEILEPFAAEVNGEVTDEGDITIFSAEVMPGASFQIQVSPNFIYFGADGGHLTDTIAREGTAKADGALDEKTYKLAMEAMTGPGLAVWDMAFFSELMSLAMESDDALEMPDELFGVFDAFSEHIQGVGLNDFQLAGNVMTIRGMTR